MKHSANMTLVGFYQEFGVISARDNYFWILVEIK